MREAHTAELMAAAKDYARRGLSVVPMTKDKRPAVRWEQYKTEAPSARNIGRWFAPGALGGRVQGVGVVCGDVSGGLVVRDFDVAGAYEQWAAEHPELAATLPTVETARGHHVYATIPQARTLKLGDGELRADGALVVCPPSLHPSGVVYRWTVPLPDGPIPTVDPSIFRANSDDSQSETAPHSWLVRPESRGSLVHPGDLEHHGPLAHPARLVRHPELDAFIAKAIAETVPAGVGKRNDGTFRMVRRMKGHPDLRDLPGVELRPIAYEWYQAALPTCDTLDFDTTYSDFLHGWDRARTAYGAALGDALRVAEDSPHPNCASVFDDPRTVLLVKLCRELQTRAGDAPFFLAGDRAAEAVDLEPRQANRRLGMLVSVGILKRVTMGHTGRASEYRYLGD